MHYRMIWPLLVAALASGQTITNFAGNGTIGYQGDNGPAIQAQIDNVVGLASDAAGNIYMADQDNNVVRRVDTSGFITTFAGVGAAGFNGETGPATETRLNGPQGVCVAPSGLIYVTDTKNHRVRAVTSGNIMTVAGNGSIVSSGDGGQAVSAGLMTPVRCGVDSSGNVYIVDQGASVIRKVTIATGVITTFAGVNNTPGFTGDNGPAAAAQMNNPTAASFDASGNLYVTDQGNQRIRKIDTNGIITTIAGNGVAAFAGDLGDAKSASLNSPGEIAIDPLDNLFIADTSNQVIREVTSAGIISTVAGIHGAAGSGNGFGPLSAQFNNPLALARDPLGSLYVGDTGNHRVRKIASLASGPPSCTYSLSAGGQAFPPAGGNGSVNITAEPGCQWTIPNIPSWIVITGYPPNGGNGTVTYEVGENGASARSVILTGNGLSYTIEQEAVSIPGSIFVGSMAHLAAEENWTSTFTFVNKGVVPATARLSFFGDALLDPTGNGPLTLPLTFPQQSGSSLPLLAATFDRTLGSYASLIFATAGPQGSPPVLVGSAQLASTNTVDGFTIFHQITTGQEAVVPMETRKATSYLLPFDNTNGLVLGVAVENVMPQAADIPVIIRNENGAPIVTQKTGISLDGNGHFQFVLSDPVNGFPETANIRGTIEFDAPPNGGQISVLGLRFTPPNNALTTIPAMAQVGSGGGSIAHLASGGDGWQTTFVLVNTGNTPTSATLNFYADQTGAALTLPLAFPQSGDGGTTMSVASYTTSALAAGATLIIVSSGAPQLLTGSAQITSTGNLSGFVIFRHNDQEAVVPLESRNAQAYIIAFDNTNGTSTGIAMNSVSPQGQTQQVNIPVTVRDDAGTAITGGMITLAPNGHYAFTLGIDKFQDPALNIRNIRGTIEFLTPTTPVGITIGALGIRIPAGATTTYTTLPALARQ
jgi:sugar lactone lactonase YvrE